MFLFLFLFFSMLLLCSFFRLKGLFQAKNGWTTSLLFFSFENAKNLGQSDDSKRRKKRGWSYKLAVFWPVWALDILTQDLERLLTVCWFLETILMPKNFLRFNTDQLPLFGGGVRASGVGGGREVKGEGGISIKRPVIKFQNNGVKEL